MKKEKSEFRTRMDAKEDIKTALGANHNNGFQNSKEYRDYLEAIRFQKYCDYVDDDNNELDDPIENDILTNLCNEESGSD